MSTKHHFDARKDREVVKEKYLCFWRETVGFFESCSAVAPPINSLINLIAFKGNEDLKGIDVCCESLAFYNLPIKQRGQYERIKICIGFEQTVIRNENELCLIRSKVRMSYYPQQGDGVNGDPESFHFDYEANKPYHPVYHLQLTDKHLKTVGGASGQATKRILGDLPRIPCAPMDIPSVITMIVADHYSDKLRDLLTNSNWQKSLPQMPFLDCSYIQSLLEDRKKIHGIHWYPESRNDGRVLRREPPSG